MAQGDELPLVLHVITGLGVGGAERMLARTSARSRGYQHKVCVLSRTGPVAAELEEAGIPIVALGLSASVSAPARLMRLRREILSSRPAILQSWLVHANISAASFAPRGVPLIWNVRHTLDGFERERLTTRLAVRGSSLLSRRTAAIVYNSRLASDHHASIGYPRDRALVIPNGFVLPAVSASTRDAFRKSIGLGRGDLAIGLIARVHPIKNHDAFLAAGQRVLADEPRAVLVLAGKGTGPGDVLAQKWGPRLFGRAIWLGERRDVADITAALDLAANVSFGEAFSNTLGEAMAAGVPCIATDVGESAELLGETGWLCKSPHPEDVENALRRALAVPADERRLRGGAAKVRIRERYSLDAATRRYEDVYDCVRDHSGAQRDKG